MSDPDPEDRVVVEAEALVAKGLGETAGARANLVEEAAATGGDVAEKVALSAVLSDLRYWGREVHVRLLGKGSRGDARSSAGLARLDIWDCSVVDQDREAVDSSTSGPSRRRLLADNKSQHRCKVAAA